MELEPKKIADLPYNTLTVYLAPALFYDTPMDFSAAEIRLVTSKEFFDAGFLKDDININQVLSKLYLITNFGNFFNNQFLLHSYLGDIILTEGEIVVYKINTFRIELPVFVLTDLQNVLRLKTSALSRNTKKKIQKFWQEHNRTKILYKVTDELYPTDYVKRKLSKKLGIDPDILNQMSDITEAIKYGTDSLEGVLENLNIRVSLTQ